MYGMKKILIVDDSPEFLRVLGRMVELLGYKPVMVENGDQALEKLGERVPGVFDCVITDVEMPVMNGLELLRNIRRINYDLPVIGMSGNGEYRCFLMSQGTWLFFDKTSLIKKLGWGISTVFKKADWYKRQRSSPRIYLRGEALITDSHPTVQARLCNISKRGMMFEVDKRDRIEKEFSAELRVNGVKITIERLSKVWESPNQDKVLTGSRISKIDPPDAAKLERCLKNLFASYSPVVGL